ncbi:hypothetical protein [Streptomyces sp. 3N207]|uniref:hypothetical protein n=1 Tax=Streptomyces sp. 3N207 TaxID=3457417 RepID=UPI003FD1C4DB
MAKRSPHLPAPPPNPYGAHPGAGWAPPRVGRRKMSSGQIIATCVGSVLAFFYVVLPVCSWLFS